MTTAKKSLVIDPSLTPDSRDYIVSILTEVETIELQQKQQLPWKTVLDKALWATPATFHNATFFGNLVLARFNGNTGSADYGARHWKDLGIAASEYLGQETTFVREVARIADFLDGARRSAADMLKAVREAFAAAGPSPTQAEIEWSCRNSLYPIGATRDTHIERLLVHLRSKQERGTEQDQTVTDILTLIDKEAPQQASDPLSEAVSIPAPKDGTLSQRTMEFLRTKIGLIPKSQLLVHDVVLDRTPEEILLMMLDPQADRPLSYYWDQYKKLATILMKSFPVPNVDFDPSAIVSLADFGLSDQNLINTEEIQRRKNLLAPGAKLRAFLEAPSEPQEYLELSAAVDLVSEWMREIPRD